MLAARATEHRGQVSTASIRAEMKHPQPGLVGDGLSLPHYIRVTPHTEASCVASQLLIVRHKPVLVQVHVGVVPRLAAVVQHDARKVLA